MSSFAVPGAPGLIVVIPQTGPQGPAGAAVGTAGTGFLHYTAGVADNPARAVNLATGDVSGILPLAEQAAPTGTGFATVTAGAWDAAAAAYPIGFAKGGTGTTALAAGVVKSTGSALAAAGLGAGLQVLRTNAGATDVEWATPNAGTITGITSTGAGAGVVANGTSGANVQVKSLIAGSNVTITNNANDITIAAAGSAPPTGTGFVTVTAGAQDAAALAFPLGVAKGGTGATTFTSNKLLYGNGASAVQAATNVEYDGTGLRIASAATSYLGFALTGTTIAGSGNIRLPYNGASATVVIGVKDSGATDRSFVTYGAGDTWVVGNFSQDLHLNAFGSTAIDMSSGIVSTVSTNETHQTSSDTQFSGPLRGYTGTSSPYSAHGNSDVALSDADHALTAAEYKNQALRFTGALTALRTITFPAPAANAGYAKLVSNMCTGVNGKLTFSTGAGTTVTPFDNQTTSATTNAAWLWIDSNGVHLASQKFAGW